MRQSTLSESVLTLLFSVKKSLLPSVSLVIRPWLAVLSSRPSFYARHSRSRVSLPLAREPSSRFVHVAAPLQKCPHWIPFMTCHPLLPRSYLHRFVPRSTATALSRPLAPFASGSASSASPALVGLAPSRASTIGGSVSDTARTPRFVSGLLPSSLPPSPPSMILLPFHFMPLLRPTRLRYHSPHPHTIQPL